MAQKKKHVKRARNDGYQGVPFQNSARQTLGMLDEVTFQDGSSRFLPLGTEYRQLKNPLSRYANTKETLHESLPETEDPSSFPVNC